MGTIRDDSVNKAKTKKNRKKIKGDVDLVNDILKQRSMIETSQDTGQPILNPTKLEKTKRFSVNSNQQNNPASEENKEEDLFSMTDDQRERTRGITEKRGSPSEIKKARRETPNTLKKQSSKSSFTTNSQFKSFLYDQIAAYTQAVMKQKAA